MPNLIGKLKSATVKGKILTLVLELGEPTPSSSGKMNLEISTGGFTDIGQTGYRGSILIGKKA